MENIDQSDISLNRYMRENLKEIAKWAKLLSIVGFIIVGFSALALLTGALMVAIGEVGTMRFAGIPRFVLVGMSLFYTLILFIYFLPCFYLFKSSKNISEGVEQMDLDLLSYGLLNLKRFFRFIGLLTVLILVIYFGSLLSLMSSLFLV